MGLFDSKASGRQILESFVKLELHKRKADMPNLQYSGSLKVKPSKHKAVFGGNAGTGAVHGTKKEMTIAEYVA